MLTYFGAAFSAILIVYFLGSFLFDPHGNSAIADVVMFLVSITAGFVVLLFTTRFLFPNGHMDVDESAPTKPRLKMAIAIVISMFTSASVAFGYFFWL